VWVPEVLDLYVQYALVDIPPSEGGGVRLKMNVFQASFTFIRMKLPRTRDEIFFFSLLGSGVFRGRTNGERDVSTARRT
jgi:hypothetical protein